MMHNNDNEFTDSGESRVPYGGPQLILRDPLELTPPRANRARFSVNHFHPNVDELVPVNENDVPPEPNWISARVTSRPNGQAVTYHQRITTYCYYDPKTKRLVSGYSENEFLYSKFFSLDSETLDFEPQGMNVDYTLPGINGTRRSVLDCISAKVDGRHGWEFKSSGSYFQEPEYRQHIVNQKDILARLGIEFHPATGNELRANRRLIDNLSFGFMHTNSIVPHSEVAAVASRVASEPSTYADIRKLLGADERLHKAKAFALLARRAIAFNIRARLQDDTIITNPVNAPILSIRTINESIAR